jgi:glucose/arabinose dehydrogenase
MKIILSVMFWAMGISLAMTAPFDDVQIDKIGGDFSHPWGISLIDDQTALVTERDGRLTKLDIQTGDRINIKAVPPVFANRQGGLLDVLVDGDDIYFCYSRIVDAGAATATAKARLDGEQLVNLEVIYTSNLISRSGVHFGCRLAIADGGIFISHGDRGMRETVQDPDFHGGTVIRIALDDGAVSIFTKGHRNPQGMAIHPDTGAIWVNEHGPRGGDEINILVEGANYGWPIVSHGREYSYGKVGEGLKTKAGYQDPVWVWTPSIAPSGMAFYEGDMFPEFRGDLLVTSLKFRSLYHVELESGIPVRETPYLRGNMGRLRDVEVLPDGSILVLSDESQGGVYRIWR